MRSHRAARRKSLELDSYRLELASVDEVSIGAYARRQRRRRVGIGLFGLAITGAAFALYWQLAPSDGANNPDRYGVWVHCAACDSEELRYLAYAQTFPIVCGQCGERAARPLWQCRACGHKFLPKTESGLVRCPICNSESVGTAVESSSNAPHAGGIE